MRAVLKRESSLVRIASCRSCSSQAWFPPAPSYWDNTSDPNNATGGGAPRPSSYGIPSRNRGMVAPGNAYVPPPPLPGDYRVQQQMPTLGNAPNRPSVIPPAPWDEQVARNQQLNRMPPPLPPVSPRPPAQNTEASEAFASLIDSLHRKGMLHEVDNVIKGMKAAQILVSMPTYRTLIDMYSQLGDFDRMDTVYMEMRKAMMKSSGHHPPEPPPSPQKIQEACDFFASLVESCHKKGLLDEVQNTYRAMKSAQLQIPIPTYKILMDTFSQLGDCEKMDAVYMEMREAMKKLALARPTSWRAPEDVAAQAFPRVGYNPARPMPPPPPLLAVDAPPRSYPEHQLHHPAHHPLHPAHHPPHPAHPHGGMTQHHVIPPHLLHGLPPQFQYPGMNPMQFQPGPPQQAPPYQPVSPQQASYQLGQASQFQPTPPQQSLHIQPSPSQQVPVEAQQTSSLEQVTSAVEGVEQVVSEEVDVVTSEEVHEGEREEITSEGGNVEEEQGEEEQEQQESIGDMEGSVEHDTLESMVTGGKEQTNNTHQEQLMESTG